jgi:hypothetical protein
MAISYDEQITFGLDGLAKMLNPTGIDFSEHGLESWTVAPVVEMELQFPFNRNDIMMELEITPFIVPPDVPIQTAFIFVGGLFVGFLSISGHTKRSFVIARSMISGRATRLSMVIPTAISPATLRMSDDQRELGLRLTSLVFRSAA